VFDWVRCPSPAAASPGIARSGLVGRNRRRAQHRGRGRRLDRAATGSIFSAWDTIADFTLRNGTAVAAGGGVLLKRDQFRSGDLCQQCPLLDGPVGATGDITIQGESTADVTLSGGAELTGTFTTEAGSTANMSLLDSIWNVAGNSNVTYLSTTRARSSFSRRSETSLFCRAIRR